MLAVGWRRLSCDARAVTCPEVTLTVASVLRVGDRHTVMISELTAYAHTIRCIIMCV